MKPGVSLVNAQASEITKIGSWTVGSITGQDEEGYDLYEFIDRERGKKMHDVPSNRMVFLASLEKKLGYK